MRTVVQIRLTERTRTEIETLRHYGRAVAVRVADEDCDELAALNIIGTPEQMALLGRQLVELAAHRKRPPPVAADVGPQENDVPTV